MTAAVSLAAVLVYGAIVRRGWVRLRRDRTEKIRRYGAQLERIGFVLDSVEYDLTLLPRRLRFVRSSTSDLLPGSYGEIDLR